MHVLSNLAGIVCVSLCTPTSNIAMVPQESDVGGVVSLSFLSHLLRSINWRALNPHLKMKFPEDSLKGTYSV